MQGTKHSLLNYVENEGLARLTITILAVTCIGCLAYTWGYAEVRYRVVYCAAGGGRCTARGAPLHCAWRVAHRCCCRCVGLVAAAPALWPGQSKTILSVGAAVVKAHERMLYAVETPARTVLAGAPKLTANPSATPNCNRASTTRTSSSRCLVSQARSAPTARCLPGRSAAATRRQQPRAYRQRRLAAAERRTQRQKGRHHQQQQRQQQQRAERSESKQHPADQRCQA
jgi:hypothetical protein